MGDYLRKTGDVAGVTADNNLRKKAIFTYKPFV